MDTEVGHIAALLHTAASDETPLQKRLDLVARRLLWACLGIVIFLTLQENQLEWHGEMVEHEKAIARLEELLGSTP